MSDVENLLRHFTNRIPSLKHLHYWNRLNELRLERYRIIYIWKVLEGMAPNCRINSEIKERLGRMCALPKLNKNSSVKIRTLRENSFQVHGPKLFYCRPAQLRNMKNCSVDEFKMQLDLILAKVPDERKVTGSEYTPSACDLFSGNPSNSIIDQIRGVSFPAVKRNPGN